MECNDDDGSGGSGEGRAQVCGAAGGGLNYSLWCPAAAVVAAVAPASAPPPPRCWPWL